jgi:hypothetical protein
MGDEPEVADHIIGVHAVRSVFGSITAAFGLAGGAALGLQESR